MSLQSTARFFFFDWNDTSFLSFHCDSDYCFAIQFLFSQLYFSFFSFFLNLRFNFELFLHGLEYPPSNQISLWIWRDEFNTKCFNKSQRSRRYKFKLCNRLSTLRWLAWRNRSTMWGRAMERMRKRKNKIVKGETLLQNNRPNRNKRQKTSVKSIKKKSGRLIGAASNLRSEISDFLHFPLFLEILFVYFFLFTT